MSELFTHSPLHESKIRYHWSTLGQVCRGAGDTHHGVPVSASNDGKKANCRGGASDSTDSAAARAPEAGGGANEEAERYDAGSDDAEDEEYEEEAVDEDAVEEDEDRSAKAARGPAERRRAISARSAATSSIRSPTPTPAKDAAAAALETVYVGTNALEPADAIDAAAAGGAKAGAEAGTADNVAAPASAVAAGALCWRPPSELNSAESDADDNNDEVDDNNTDAAVRSRGGGHRGSELESDTLAGADGAEEDADVEEGCRCVLKAETRALPAPLLHSPPLVLPYACDASSFSS